MSTRGRGKGEAAGVYAVVSSLPTEYTGYLFWFELELVVLSCACVRAYAWCQAPGVDSRKYNSRKYNGAGLIVRSSDECVRLDVEQGGKF